MKPDLRGLAEPYRWVKTTGADPDATHHSTLCAGIFGKDSFDHVGYEGRFVFRANARYYLSCAQSYEGRYSLEKRHRRPGRTTRNPLTALTTAPANQLTARP
jgi:hypothetical protein